jgi:hypothetical protein
MDDVDKRLVKIKDMFNKIINDNTIKLRWAEKVNMAAITKHIDENRFSYQQKLDLIEEFEKGIQNNCTPKMNQ